MRTLCWLLAQRFWIKFWILSPLGNTSDPFVGVPTVNMWHFAHRNSPLWGAPMTQLLAFQRSILVAFCSYRWCTAILNKVSEWTHCWRLAQRFWLKLYGWTLYLPSAQWFWLKSYEWTLYWPLAQLFWLKKLWLNTLLAVAQWFLLKKLWVNTLLAFGTVVLLGYHQCSPISQTSRHSLHLHKYYKITNKLMQVWVLLSDSSIPKGEPLTKVKFYTFVLSLSSCHLLLVIATGETP